MNNIKKAFSLLLVTTLLASLIAMPSFAAAPSVGYVEYLSFNSRPVAQAGKAPYTDMGDNRLTVATACTSSDYAAGIYGKSSSDYALVLDSVGDGIHDYNLSWGKFSQAAQAVGTTIHYGYEFAIDANASKGVEQFVAILNSMGQATDTGHVLSTSELGATATNRVVEFETGDTDAANKVILFGQLEADFAWQRGQWYTVDILLTKGSDNAVSYMTIYVNGMPLKLKDGKTLDGAKTTTQKFVVDGAHDIAGIQPVTSFGLNAVRIKNGLAESASGNVYLDNVRAYTYTPGSDTLMNINKPVYDYYDWINTDFSDSTIPARINASTNGASLKVVNEDGNNVLAQYRNQKYSLMAYGAYMSVTDKAQVSDRIKFSLDLKAKDANTHYAISMEGDGDALYAAHGTLDPYAYSSTMPAAEKFSKAAAAAMIGSWINHEIIIDKDDKSFDMYINGLPQTKIPVTKSTTANGQLRIKVGIGSDTVSETDYIAIDNVKVIGQNYYPTIKSLNYSANGVASTDDYAVPYTTDTIVASLESRITDASAENLAKIELVDKAGNTVATAQSYDDTNLTVTFAIPDGLASKSVYKVVIPADFTLTAGNAMGTDFEYSFKTAYKPFEIEAVKFMTKAIADSTNPNPEFKYHTSGRFYDGTTLGAEISIINTTGDSKSMSAILAVYSSDGELVGCEVMPITTSASNVYRFTGVTPHNTGACITKVFAFDSMTSITPIDTEYYLWQNINDNGGEGQPIWQ